VLTLSVQYGVPVAPSAVLAREGPKVEVELRVPKQLADYLTQHGQSVPDPVTGPGLIDTGASTSMVDANVVKALGVQPVGYVWVYTASGRVQCPTYPLQLRILDPPRSPLLVEELASITSGPLQQMKLLCLVGRDILRRGIFIYNGAHGSVCLTF
jgi:hypothetical protein